MSQEFVDSRGAFGGEVWRGYCWADCHCLGSLGSVGAESGCIGFLVAVELVVGFCWCGVGRDEVCIITVEVDFERANGIGNYGNVFRYDGAAYVDGRFGREGDHGFGVGREC